MRKNTARHWLHGALDLLPVLIIPIFAIYIINHEPQPISITAETEEVVDFNQQLKNGNFLDNTNWSVGSGSFTIQDNIANVRMQSRYTDSGLRQYVNFELNHIYFAWCYAFQESGNTFQLSIGQPFAYSRVNVESGIQTKLSYRWKITQNSGANWQRLEIGNRLGDNNLYEFQVSNVNLVDLTKAYGVGNEPTISDFENDFPNAFYDYIDSELVSIDTAQVVYDDTDIGSQFIYQLYHVTDKYFNMGNVFNLGNVYDWFNVNIFYGQSPFVMSIVYNIIVYEFVMDLLFLLYGLFMFFIDMCKRLIEKPLDSIK